MSTIQSSTISFESDTDDEHETTTHEGYSLSCTSFQEDSLSEEYSSNSSYEEEDNTTITI